MRETGGNTGREQQVKRPSEQSTGPPRLQKDLKPGSGLLRAQFQRIAAGLGSSLREEERDEGSQDSGKTWVVIC